METEFPYELFYLIGKHISDKKTFHSYALCFPDISRRLKPEKFAQFLQIPIRFWFNPNAGLALPIAYVAGIGYTRIT